MVDLVFVFVRSERVCKRATDSLAVGAPRLQALPGLEFDHVLAVRYRPQLRDPAEVHDVRSVNAQKASGIECALDGVHWHVQEVGRRTCVQANVVLECLDPINLVDPPIVEPKPR